MHLERPRRDARTRTNCPFQTVLHRFPVTSERAGRPRGDLTLGIDGCTVVQDQVGSVHCHVCALPERGVGSADRGDDGMRVSIGRSVRWRVELLSAIG